MAETENDVRTRSQERDRPKGRPIGAVGEANCREIKEVAETEGFEPSIPLWGMLI